MVAGRFLLIGTEAHTTLAGLSCFEGRPQTLPEHLLLQLRWLLPRRSLVFQQSLLLLPLDWDAHWHWFLQHL